MTQVRPALAPPHLQTDATPRLKTVSHPPRGFGGLLLRIGVLLMLVSVGLIAMVIGASAAFTPEDEAIAALFGSPECSAPCFLGIRPGETTVHEAQALLEDHPWVDRVLLYGDEGSPYRLTWFWSANAPESLKGERFDPYILVMNDQTIAMVILDSNVRYGSIWMSLGEPDRAEITPNGRPSIFSPLPMWYTHSSRYFGSVYVKVHTICPFTVYDFWNTPVELSFMSPAYAVFGYREPFSRETWVNSEWC